MDDRTPVLVGAGQAVDRLGDPDYRTMSATDLAAEAGARAIEDTGGRPSEVRAALDTIAAVRTFELSQSGMPTLGFPDNLPRAIGRRLGVDPDLAVLEVAGGQSPQRLVNEFCGRIAGGELEAVLVAGGEAISTLQHHLGREGAPDFSEAGGGQLEDRGPGWSYYIDEYAIAHALYTAPAAYALVDHARRAELGLSREAYLAQMGELFAPFTAVAAANPWAAVREERTPTELTTVDRSNPMIWDPYPRRLIAREKVNLGAAVVLMSVAAARRAGVPPERWVFLHGHADAVEVPFLARPALGRSHAAVAATEHALSLAGVGVPDLTSIDLYSCFASPVFNVADGLGIAADDPRRLTVTGGLPFFGGPGNNYSMHAIAETVARVRAGGVGLVGANGGILSKYSVGVYAGEPRAWQGGDEETLHAVVESQQQTPVVRHADGPAVVETYTVRHTPDGPGEALVVGRLDATGGRFVARADADLAADLLAADPLGATVVVRADGPVNRAASR